MAPVDLRALLWGYNAKYGTMTIFSLLSLATLSVWYRHQDLYALSTEPSQLTSLFDNPALLDSKRASAYGTYDRESWPTARSFEHLNTPHWAPSDHERG